MWLCEFHIVDKIMHWMAHLLDTLVRGLVILMHLVTEVTSWLLVLPYFPIYIVDSLDQIYSPIFRLIGRTYRNA